MSKNTEQQKAVDTAHTVVLQLTPAAGGGDVVASVVDEKGSKWIKLRCGIIAMKWPVPVAYMVGRMLMHLATRIDPSLAGKL